MEFSRVRRMPRWAPLKMGERMAAGIPQPRTRRLLARVFVVRDLSRKPGQSRRLLVFAFALRVGRMNFGHQAVNLRLRNLGGAGGSARNGIVSKWGPFQEGKSR
jgi:hypothetical protein